jgi:hypothetical protein
MRHLLLVLPLLALACDPPPPVKTASGMRLAYVSIEERFPVNPDVKETKLEGEALRKAVAILDKNGIFDLAGKTFETKGVVASGTVTLVMHPVDQPEQRVTVKSCAQEKVCAFFEEARAEGLVAHKPVVCGGNTTACDKP